MPEHINCSFIFCLEVSDHINGRNFTNSSYSAVTLIAGSEYVYVIMTAVTSGLSIIGGMMICVLYVSFRDMRTTSRRLLFFLALSDALLALGNLLGVIWYLYSDSEVIQKNNGYCAFQSAMTIYFSITSFFWTVIMALNLFHAVVLKKASFAATYMNLFHLLAWIPPGIIISVALGMNVLGTDTSLEQASWCWIDPRAPHVLVWQFATGKFWEILAYVTVVVLYTSVKIFLKKQETKKKTMVGPESRKRSRRDVTAEANRKLTFVPFVFIVCRIWGTLRFLLGNFAVEHINEPYVIWINPLQGIGDSAQGFANCVLYCLSTEKIRQRLERVICPKRSSFYPAVEFRTDSNSKFSQRTKAGIADDPCLSYTDVLNQLEQNQTDSSKGNTNDQSASIIDKFETGIDQSPASINEKSGRCIAECNYALKGSIIDMKQPETEDSANSKETNEKLINGGTDKTGITTKNRSDVIKVSGAICHTGSYSNKHCLNMHDIMTEKAKMQPDKTLQMFEIVREHSNISQ